MSDGTSLDDIKKTIGDFFQSMYVIQQTSSGGHGYQGHQPMEIDHINGFKGKERRAKESQRAHQSRANEKARKDKENIRIRFSNGTTVRISRPQVRARIRKDLVHSTKAKAKEKASHQSLAGLWENRSYFKSLLEERTCISVGCNRLRAASNAA
eukprot:4197000-Amphidinium_carterae.2